jgi:uncharacterized protein (DUF1330 family)
LSRLLARSGPDLKKTTADLSANAVKFAGHQGRESSRLDQGGFVVSLNNYKGKNAMKLNIKTCLAVAAGALLGAIGVSALHAQAKAPVYLVTDIAEITDLEGYKAIGARSNEAAAQNFASSGGQYLARTTNISPLDGAPPKRLIITRFDNTEKAKAWYNSPEQKKVTDIRTKTTKSRVFIVEGL